MDSLFFIETKITEEKERHQQNPVLSETHVNYLQFYLQDIFLNELHILS